ncbi:hypothetical protein G3A49_15180 [Haloferax volcanii]|uniref:Uncharacterized protein n=1 Tax=Haloferax volcanii TaxID=2246 RepID=A0A6C0UUZ9_HALVO|nr:MULTISPECIES: helix-turn-helix transcriptional regulator [Haloferax]QIB79376.1 hypothetical protein G3A49_15180 [Haloferax alexandrinus]
MSGKDEQNMTDGVKQVTFEATGESAVKSIIDLLERFQEDSEFKQVRVELATSEWSSNQTDKGRAEIEQASLLDMANGKTEKNRIQSGTSHHKVLSVLSDLGDELPVPTKRVLKDVDLPEGTAYAAMSTLRERGLVVSQEEGPNGSNRYDITEAGQSELRRLGGSE